ncbi:MAG: hypothetical protein IKO20_01815 [Bacteroidaceae bacterium]|nr:hypothetical protein [Bacteroidaceae bacterium]
MADSLPQKPYYFGTKFQSWWDRMAQKYQWESAPDGNWEINFDTKEIFLVQP